MSRVRGVVHPPFGRSEFNTSESAVSRSPGWVGSLCLLADGKWTGTRHRSKTRTGRRSRPNSPVSRALSVTRLGTGS